MASIASVAENVLVQSGREGEFDISNEHEQLA